MKTIWNVSIVIELVEVLRREYYTSNFSSTVTMFIPTVPDTNVFHALNLFIVFLHPKFSNLAHGRPEFNGDSTDSFSYMAWQRQGSQISQWWSWSSRWNAVVYRACPLGNSQLRKHCHPEIYQSINQSNFYSANIPAKPGSGARQLSQIEEKLRNINRPGAWRYL